jgi:Na+-transporting methylmalonyl-CoA/oxaloacetate decarboxylase gamma subunit
MYHKGMHRQSHRQELALLYALTILLQGMGVVLSLHLCMPTTVMYCSGSVEGKCESSRDSGDCGTRSWLPNHNLAELLQRLHR